MDTSQHNGLPIRFLLLECCGSCKWAGDCHILGTYPSIYPDFVCDFYVRRRVSGSLRRKKAKIKRGEC